MKCENKEGNLSCEQVKSLDEIISRIPDDDEIYRDSEAVKALSDPTRLKIIYLLSHGELCVCEIMAALGKSQPTASHHLNILKNAGFLKWRKDGVWTYYKLSNPKILDNLKELLKNR